MSRVPITVMGYRCDRCGHEWIPRGEAEREPRTCPHCKSAHWNAPKKRPQMTYVEFRDKVKSVLSKAEVPLTWTEIRTRGELPQVFPNNVWVRQMEKDGRIVLNRKRQKDGIIRWSLG